MNYSNQLNRTELKEGLLPYSSAECIAWLTVFMTEAVAIVTFNIITIIVFMRNRSLRKRSMYLVINLAVADMLVGGFSEVMAFFFLGAGMGCDFWQYNVTSYGFWDNVILSMETLFTTCSLTNIAAISLERVHATFLPFTHRVIGKWIFGVIIAVVWVLAVLSTSAIVVVWNLVGNTRLYMDILQGFNFICLLVICVSYASIAVKISRGAHPHRHGAASRERKLTKTLFIVTLISLLTWLPRVIFMFVSYLTNFSSISLTSYSRINDSFVVLYFANSLVNPILYTFRMPEFKRALVSLFRRSAQQQGQVQVFPLRVM